MPQELYGIAIIPLLVGLVDLIKKIGLPDKLAPLVSLSLGLGLMFVYGLTEADWTVLQCVVTGTFLGLSTVGLYSGVKNVAQYFSPDETI